MRDRNWRGCAPRFFSHLGNPTSDHFGRMSRWPGFAAMELPSRGNVLSIGLLRLRNEFGSVELMQSPAPGESGYRMLASLQLDADPDFPKRAGRL